MGVRPDRGPGDTNLTRNGMSAAADVDAAAAGKLRALYIAGLEPGHSRARRSLPRWIVLELLVVQDLFLTADGPAGRLVLPAAAFAEREGTFTNAERRVQRFRAGAQCHGREPRRLADLRQIWAPIWLDCVPAPAEPGSRGRAGQSGASKRRQAVPSARRCAAVGYRSADDVNAEITAGPSRSIAAPSYRQLS